MRLAPQETRTYFVTAVSAQRRSIFQVTRTAELFEETLMSYRTQGKYLLHAYVIMPDHFHLMLTPTTNVSLEKAVQLIKGGFSFRYKSKLDVWERSFNEAQIKTPEKYGACTRYIEENPVRKRLVESASMYRFSSVSRDDLDSVPLHLRG